PILIEGADVAYSNPLPHVLMLTAIVVGIATTALALALVVRVHEAYGSIEEDEILAADRALEMGSAALGALEERRGRQEDDRALAEAAHKDRLAQTDESEETPT
ncbi:MAG: cation:proton antiporter subunit C, partial [Acidobacteriota bacterium]